MSSTTLYARIRVLYKSPVKNWISVVEVKMMYNSISKLCRKHLPQLRMGNHKACRGKWYICAVIQFIAKIMNIFIKISLKTNDIRLFLLILPSTIKGKVKIKKQIVISECVWAKIITIHISIIFGKF